MALLVLYEGHSAAAIARNRFSGSDYLCAVQHWSKGLIISVIFGTIDIVTKYAYSSGLIVASIMRRTIDMIIIYYMIHLRTGRISAIGIRLGDSNKRMEVYSHICFHVISIRDSINIM